jgi:hypothetical protein
VYGAGMPPTAGVGSNFPPGAMPSVAAASYAPQIGYAPPTTQQTWQKPAHATASEANQPRRSSSALVAMLGVMTGVVLLGLLGGGGFFLYSKKISEDTAQAQAQATAQAVAAAAAPVAPGTDGTGAVATTATTPTTVAVAGAAKKVDAGGGVVAAAAPKDAGAAVASAKPKTEEDLESQKRIAASQCSHMQFLLRSNDASNNNQAKQVKLLSCLRASGPQGTNCERANCRSACSMLQDKQCLFQLENGERNFPAKF